MRTDHRLKMTMTIRGSGWSSGCAIITSIADARVLDAMGRSAASPFRSRRLSSRRHTRTMRLPISGGQTISQPFIVARMTEILELVGREKVLEIGAGSGYQTAVLAALVRSGFRHRTAAQSCGRRPAIG